VERPDRDELLAIRDGASSYEDLVKRAKTQDAELDAIAATSTQPREPDRAAIDLLCREIVESML
jgi:hypothetical protein